MANPNMDAESIEALVDTLAKLDGNALNREVVRSLGDIVGLDKEDQIGSPFVVRDEDGEFATVYNSFSGLPSRVTVTMLPRLMQRKFSRQHVEVPEEFWGRRVWTATKPKVEPRTELPCVFGEAAPEREVVLAAGLGHINCRKANIPTESARRLHAEHSHKTSWTAYREHIVNRDASDDRAAQRELLQVIAQLAKAK